MFELSVKQKELKKKHGTPDEFSIACFKAVPDFISVREADIAIDIYNKQWIEAGARRCLRMKKIN